MGFRSDRGWTRSEALSAVAATERFDLVVVGGGVIGGAVALDAAARGLHVCVIEQNDFASGTSSKSTKLLHGGIRYLPQLQFGLIREGLLEQRVLARTADYLFRPLEFALPMYQGRSMGDLPRWASSPRLMPVTMRIGLTLYDLLGNRRGDLRHRRLNSEEILERLPTLHPEGLRRGFAYMDAQTDDARLTIGVLKTAVRRYETAAVSRVTASGVEYSGDGFRVLAVDRESGEELAIETRAVISATWAFRPPHLHGNAPAPRTQLSKGVHLLYRAHDLSIGDSAVVLPETDDGRVLFVVPWQGMALLGTTDTAYTGDPGRVVADDADIEYLTRHLRQYVDAPDATPVSAFAGVRALIDEGGRTASASRAHTMVAAAPGYTQVFGGKLTAYRRIAAEAVDTLAEHLSISAHSPTETEVLIGAGVPDDLVTRLTPRIEATGLPAIYADRLVGRYGTEAERILQALEGHPGLRPTLGVGDLTLAEVAYAVDNESASTVADVALRRTHLAWSVSDHGRADATAIADLMAERLGWDDAERSLALEAYETELVAEGL